jgi:hypothetical protein
MIYFLDFSSLINSQSSYDIIPLCHLVCITVLLLFEKDDVKYVILSQASRADTIIKYHRLMAIASIL